MNSMMLYAVDNNQGWWIICKIVWIVYEDLLIKVMICTGDYISQLWSRAQPDYWVQAERGRGGEVIRDGQHPQYCPSEGGGFCKHSPWRYCLSGTATDDLVLLVWNSHDTIEKIVHSKVDRFVSRGLCSQLLCLHLNSF